VKVLLISQAFPPFNASGSVRVGKLASFLLDAGNDVRVLTAAPLPYPRTLPEELPAPSIVRTRSYDPFAWLAQRRGRSAGISTPSRSLIGEGRRGRLLRLLGAALALPEPQAGWFFPAVSAGARLCASWRPDVIYASALPFTSHLVAARLAATTGAPWVGEFRDLFAENPYSNLPSWRGPLDKAIERRVVASAAALVTVSEPIAETLRSRHHKRTVVVLNGFDERDSASTPYPATSVAAGPAPLRILYTGLIYPGRRDPSALFAAMAALDLSQHAVTVDFYGQDLRGVEGMAARNGVSDHVRVHPPISYAASLAEQAQADVLLLLLWNDPREVGVYTGKLFEYIGAGRPVLAVGVDSGVAPDLIRTRGLGVVASSPSEIAAALQRWSTEKRETGRVAGPPRTARTGLSRREQFAIILSLLQELSASTSARR
jgi:glycosyltransferase involved in cell wall biosynthesis